MESVERSCHKLSARPEIAVQITAVGSNLGAPRNRARIGEAWIDSITCAEALDAIEHLVTSRSSGFVVPLLMQRAALRHSRVYLVGAGPGVAQEAAEKIARTGVEIVGRTPPILSR